MDLRHRFLQLACLGALGAISSYAAATTEPPALYDARSVGMGGTGVSHIHNGASMYHNVAELHEIQTLAITADITPSTTSLKAPLDGPNSSVASKSSIVPLFLLGGAYRLTDRVVVGLAAYGVGGFGTEYTTTQLGVNKLQLGAIEASPGVAFALAKNLSIGAGYRVTYLMQQAHARIAAGPPFPTGYILENNLSLSGFNFFGFDAGVYYRPISPLKLGFAYRSKVTTDLSGTSKAAALTLDTTSSFSFPHEFKLGAAYQIIDSLLVAADVKYLLHSEANKETVINIQLPVGKQTQILDWKDSIAVGVGAEYHVIEMVPVRAGYRITTSATPQDRPGPFFTPPGLLHSVHAGAGLELGNVDVDLGGFYSWGGADTTAQPMPGRYSMVFIEGALSVTYHQ